MIELAQKITGMKINIKTDQPRAGDPALLVADATKAFLMLGFTPLVSNTEFIMQSAYRFMMQQKNYQEPVPH